MNIKDSPIAKLGTTGANVANYYKDMDVVWDFSRETDAGNVAIDLMVNNPVTGVSLFRRNTLSKDLSYNRLVSNLQVYSSVLKTIGDLQVYVSTMDQVYKNAFRDWMVASGHVHTKNGWVKLLQGNYEE